MKRYFSATDETPYLNTTVQITTPTYPDFVTYHYPPQPLGIFTEYRAEYWGYFQFFAGSQYYGYAPNYFTPDIGESFGETTNLQSPMSGGSGIPNNERFLLSYIYTLGWIPFDGIMVIDYPSWHWGTKDSTTAMRIWDWACYE